MALKIDEILRRAVERHASDVHFSADSPVMIREHGDLLRLDDVKYSDKELQEILYAILSDPEKKKFLEHKNLDKSYSVPNCGNFRVNCFWSRRGVGAVIRWLPTKMPEIDDLGLPPIVKKLADLPKGLLLVTGPTGSGKSTTLAAIINHMNTNFPYHILTVEDPVEFVHPNKASLINQREIGQSCLTFADALKYALREDPDVILVGEMRDQETISLALTAAETGHLVLGTLHTRGAASAIDRIIESFPATERPLIRVMLSESLRAVISQILIKAKDGKGRVAAYEIMVSNYAISNLIREGKTFQIPSILQTSRGEGMLQMETHIRTLMAEGKIDPAEGDAVLSSFMRANQSSSGATANPAAGGAVKTPIAAGLDTKVPKGPDKPVGGPSKPPGLTKAPLSQQPHKEGTSSSIKVPEIKASQTKSPAPLQPLGSLEGLREQTSAAEITRSSTKKVESVTAVPPVSKPIAPIQVKAPSQKTESDFAKASVSAGATPDKSSDKVAKAVAPKSPVQVAAAPLAPKPPSPPVVKPTSPAPIKTQNTGVGEATTLGIQVRPVAPPAPKMPVSSPAKPPATPPGPPKTSAPALSQPGALPPEMRKPAAAAPVKNEPPARVPVTPKPKPPAPAPAAAVTSSINEKADTVKTKRPAPGPRPIPTKKAG